MPVAPTPTDKVRKPPPPDRDLATLLCSMGSDAAVAGVYTVSVSTLACWKRAAKKRNPGWLDRSTTGSIAAQHIREQQQRDAKELAKLIAKIPLAAVIKVCKYLETELADPKDAHAQAMFAAQYVPAVSVSPGTTEATLVALQMKIRHATAPVHADGQ